MRHSVWDVAFKPMARGKQGYFLGNALGSTQKLTDGSGNVVAS